MTQPKVIVANEFDRPLPAELAPLLALLHKRFGGDLVAVLFYGSCRREGVTKDSLIDLYVVLESRRRERPLVRVLGRLLAPNVYFLSSTDGARTVRAKVGVFTRADLRRAPTQFESYLWARLAQPMSLAWVRSTDDREELKHLVCSCVKRFAEECLPMAAGQTLDLGWIAGLRRSYETELRPEGRDRAAQVIGENPEYYLRMTRALAPKYFREDEHGQLWVNFAGAAAPYLRRWALRRFCGKFLSFARLVKGLITFDGAVDYVVWKLTRHSGQTIEVPERVRRWPWLFIWGLFVRLYRQGLFR